MFEFFSKLFDASDFRVPTTRGGWTSGLVRLHNIPDAVIGFSYMAIPAVPVYFVRRRRDIPFHWMFLMFGAFIVWCGLTHLMGLIVFYHPVYRLSGLVKPVTAAVSLATVFPLIPITPRVLNLPCLASLTPDLKEEIEQRQ